MNYSVITTSSCAKFFPVAIHSYSTHVISVKNLNIRTASGQLAEYLKDEIRAGKWTSRMPGESWLMAHLQVGRGTVRGAMAQLEEEGVLVSHGQGKWRKVAMGRDDSTARKIRIGIMPYEKLDRSRLECSSLLAGLLEAGIDAGFSEKSLKEMDMDVERVARHVNRNPADAWVVIAASREVLEWFAGQRVPALAMSGRHYGLPIAAAYPVMISGQSEAVARLIELGHKRIVMLTRAERRKPHLSRPEQTFIDQLEAAGIRTGQYNLPGWEETREGLNHMLDELFRFSPPTALYFQEAQLFIAARNHLADHGITAPRDVSLVVADSDPSFKWCNPVPSHIHWDHRPVVRRVVRWAKNVAQGKDDRLKSGTEAKLIEGGTIGPVPGGVR